MCPWGYDNIHEFVHTSCCEEEITTLESQIKKLESDVQDAKLDGATEVNNSNVNTPTSNVKVTNDITSNTKVVAKSVYMDGASINGKMDVTASENIEVVDVKVGGAHSGSTVVFNLKEAEKVIFKGMVFDAEDSYNAVNVSLTGENLVKEVIFEDCVFKGVIRNNGVSVYGTQDDAVITFKNNTFERVSNPFRLCNRGNAKNVTLNIINCDIKSWETSNPDYAGLVLCEDIVSSNNDESISNNFFSKDKITINIENTIGPNGKNMVDYVKENGIQNTVVYVWCGEADVKLVNAEENPDAYPTVNVK